MEWRRIDYYRTTGIRPYRLINKSTDINKLDSMNHSRAKVVIGVIDDIVAVSATPPPNISQLTLPQTDLLLHSAYCILLSRMFPSSVDLTRKDEVSYGTAYNLVIRRDTEGTVGKKRNRK